MKNIIKRSLTFILALILTAGLFGCGTASTGTTAAEPAALEASISETAAETPPAVFADTSNPIVTIVYTNDIHAHVANVITEKGADGNFICSFEGTENPEDLYASVQKAIDDVKDEADYIIALGHICA